MARRDLGAGAVVGADPMKAEGTLEAEKDHWQRRYLEAERHRTELLILIGLMRDEKARLREALARILDEAGVLKLGGVRRVARAALAETQENAE